MGLKYLGMTAEIIDDDIENSIKKMLTNWGDKQKSMPKGIGVVMNINNINCKPQFINRFKLLTVKRETNTVEVPGNTAIENQNASDNPYDYSYFLPDKFEKSEGKKFYLPSTVNTYTCPTTEKCKECAGTGNCVKCHGQGELRCTKCAGKGWKIETLGDKKGLQVNCDSCSGSGYKRCSHCGNLIQFSKRSSGRCPTCNGTGEITCSRCSGSGYFQKFVMVDTNYNVHNTETGFSLFDGFDVSFFEKFKGTVVYNNLLISYENQNDYSDNSDDLQNKIGDKCVEYEHYSIDEYLENIQKVNYNGKIGKVNIEVHEFPTWEVSYTFHGESFVIFLVKTTGFVSIYAESIPMLSNDEIQSRKSENLKFYFNPFYGQNTSFQKAKYFVSFAMMQVLADGIKSSEEIELLKKFIDSTSFSIGRKQKLKQIVDNNTTKDILLSEITKIPLKRFDKLKGFVFALTFLYRLKGINGINKSDEDILLSDFAKILPEIIIDEKLRTFREQAKANIILFDKGIFGDVIPKKTTGQYVLKSFILLSYIALIFSSYLYLSSSNHSPELKILNQKDTTLNIPEYRLDIPFRSMNDTLWKNAFIGKSSKTISGYPRGGTAVCVASMVMSGHGIDQNPLSFMNITLSNNGFADSLILWKSLERYPGSKVKCIGYRQFIPATAKRLLDDGNPIPLRTKSRIVVVITGYRNNGEQIADFLVNDPSLVSGEGKSCADYPYDSIYVIENVSCPVKKIQPVVAKTDTSRTNKIDTLTKKPDAVNISTGIFEGVAEEGIDSDYSYFNIKGDDGKKYTFMLVTDYKGSQFFIDGKNIGKKISFSWKKSKEMTYGGEMEIEKLIEVQLLN